MNWLTESDMTHKEKKLCVFYFMVTEAVGTTVAKRFIVEQSTY